MTTLTLTLPLPPGINGTGDTRGAYAVVSVRGVPRLVTSRRARQWRKEAAFLVSSAARQQEWYAPSGPLTLTVERGDRHDLDSGIKLLMDAVADGLGINDRMFADLHILRRDFDDGDDSVLVTVEEWDR